MLKMLFKASGVTADIKNWYQDTRLLIRQCWKDCRIPNNPNRIWSTAFLSTEAAHPRIISDTFEQKFVHPSQRSISDEEIELWCVRKSILMASLMIKQPLQ